MMREQLDVVNKRIDVLNTKMDVIEKKIDCLLSILEQDVSKDCAKMSKHINFVENVYAYVKNPLLFFVDKVNTIYNLKSSSSPSISL